jgi:hypothetical protein
MKTRGQIRHPVCDELTEILTVEKKTDQRITGGDKDKSTRFHAEAYSIGS